MADGAATRRRAADAVAAVLDGRSLADALPPALAGLDARDRALAQELAYGTVRWWLRIDAWLALLVERKPKDNALVALLGIGLHQLRGMRVPEHAAVAATVDAAPKSKRGFVNAVLRNAQRRAAELDAVGHDAHPGWLRDALQRDWPGSWRDIVDANNAPAPMTLRARDRQATLSMLADAGIDARPSMHARDGIVLGTPMAVDALPGFASGAVSVQDGAAQLCADLLDLRDGLRVLDACAAPGGKACHALERAAVELVAVELDGARIARIDANLARLGLSASVMEGDAARPGDWWDGRPFDRILIDAPCSATGVIRRHPDIRLLRRARDVAELASRQRTLIEALWPLLAPGGRLVYATCSVLREENDAVVEAFVASNGAARAEPIDADWGLATAHGRQVLPGQDGMDGFYYACLRDADDR